MPIVRTNRNNVAEGDLVEIYDYDNHYNGTIGTVLKNSNKGSIWNIKTTKPHRAYPIIGDVVHMYVGNLRLVDNSASFIPEDWS